MRKPSAAAHATSWRIIRPMVWRRGLRVDPPCLIRPSPKASAAPAWPGSRPRPCRAGAGALARSFRRAHASSCVGASARAAAARPRSNSWPMVVAGRSPSRRGRATPPVSLWRCRRSAPSSHPGASSPTRLMTRTASAAGCGFAALRPRPRPPRSAPSRIRSTAGPAPARHRRAPHRPSQEPAPLGRPVRPPRPRPPRGVRPRCGRRRVGEMSPLPKRRPFSAPSSSAACRPSCRSCARSPPCAR